jgi:hypothetical protein
VGEYVAFRVWGLFVALEAMNLDDVGDVFIAKRLSNAVHLEQTK